jgi:hypothetical protein
MDSTASLDNAKEEKSLALAGIEPKFLGHPAYSLVTVVTTLS